VLGPVEASYPVVWWDPHALALGVQAPFGIRHQGLVEDAGAGVVEAGRRAYEEWRATRTDALEQGARPSIATRTVTEWSRHAPADSAPPEVLVVDAATGVKRPTGPRFGTLVHAILATVPLDGGRPAILDAAALRARIVAATPEERAAAAALVEAALGHALLARARAAWTAGRCWRETPITVVDGDGSILEGVLDLAFEEAQGWTVVDFKTEAELAGALPRYRRQVGLYAAVVERATGRPAVPVIMRL
jgi:ATP-dependent exoDNAse (exonuclease V) beta subunit